MQQRKRSSRRRGKRIKHEALGVGRCQGDKYDVLLLKTMLVLHIALVLQHLGPGSQNEGGVDNADNQINVPSPTRIFSWSFVGSGNSGGDQ